MRTTIAAASALSAACLCGAAGGGTPVPTYYIVYEPDLGCYPNYSFEVGDVDGDGRMECVVLDQSAKTLRAVRLDGSTAFEHELPNEGTWGTAIPAVADLDDDGRAEIVVPCPGADGAAGIVVIDGSGRPVATRGFRTTTKDAYGLTVPLLAAARLRPGSPPGIVAAITGGPVVALDGALREVWRVEGLRHDFGHEFHVSDFDGDGLDEVAFCTVDRIAGPGPAPPVGELLIVDHDGTVLLRRNVSDYAQETHFDDMAMADFEGTGTAQVLIEKGILIDLAGSVLWDVAATIGHGQWIAHTSDPGGKGRLIFISALWGEASTSALLTGGGRRLASTGDLAWTQLDPERLKGWRVLATRPHFISWSPGEAPELFVAEQACSPTSHACYKTEEFELRAFILDSAGGLLATVPFQDAQIEGYWYNGEVRSRVADVDGDGCDEVVFPRQSGHVMVLKKRR